MCIKSYKRDDLESIQQQLSKNLLNLQTTQFTINGKKSKYKFKVQCGWIFSTGNNKITYEIYYPKILFTMDNAKIKVTSLKFTDMIISKKEDFCQFVNFDGLNINKIIFENSYINADAITSAYDSGYFNNFNEIWMPGRKWKNKSMV